MEDPNSHTLQSNRPPNDKTSEDPKLTIKLPPNDEDENDRFDRIVAKNKIKKHKIDKIIFIQNAIIDFIKNYLKETEEQKLEKFDTLEINKQKELLTQVGYQRSEYLEGFLKSTQRMVGVRNNNKARAEEKFNNARYKYLVLEKIKELKGVNEIFRIILEFNSNNYSDEGIENISRYARDLFSSYLSKLKDTNAKHATISSLKESGGYTPKEYTFRSKELNIFSGQKAATANQSAGKRRNRTKKARRNKGKNTRRN